MEKATNAELKSIITEQQEKYKSLTKLLEKQLEAHNLQQQQQTDAFNKFQETILKQQETINQLLNSKTENAVNIAPNSPTNYVPVNSQQKRLQTDWESLITGTYEFSLINSNLLEKQALWKPQFLNIAPVQHIEWIKGNNKEPFAEFKTEYLTKWAPDYQLEAQTKMIEMQQGNKDILKHITEIVNLAKASETRNNDALIVQSVVKKLSDRHKKTFEAVRDFDTLWQLALQNQHTPQNTIQPRYASHHKPIDRNITHSRYKTSTKQVVSSKKSCINHPNSHSHSTAECKSNTKKKKLSNVTIALTYRITQPVNAHENQKC